MPLRSFKERILQTLCYEIGGILLVTPLYVLAFATSGSDSLVLIVSLSVAMLIWFPLHSAVFDWAEFRLTGGVASDRLQRLRALNALSLEVSGCLISMPLLIWIGGHSLIEAFLVDVALTFSYVVYAYVFNVVYDHIRPVLHEPYFDLALGAPYPIT